MNYKKFTESTKPKQRFVEALTYYYGLNGEPRDPRKTVDLMLRKARDQRYYHMNLMQIALMIDDPVYYRLSMNDSRVRPLIGDVTSFESFKIFQTTMRSRLITDSKDFTGMVFHTVRSSHQKFFQGCLKHLIEEYTVDKSDPVVLLVYSMLYYTGAFVAVSNPTKALELIRLASLDLSLDTTSRVTVPLSDQVEKDKKIDDINSDDDSKIKVEMMPEAKTSLKTVLKTTKGADLSYESHSYSSNHFEDDRATTVYNYVSLAVEAKTILSNIANISESALNEFIERLLKVDSKKIKMISSLFADFISSIMVYPDKVNFVLRNDYVLTAENLSATSVVQNAKLMDVLNSEQHVKRRFMESNTGLFFRSLNTTNRHSFGPGVFDYRHLDMLNTVDPMMLHAYCRLALIRDLVKCSAMRSLYVPQRLNNLTDSSALTKKIRASMYEKLNEEINANINKRVVNSAYFLYCLEIYVGALYLAQIYGLGMFGVNIDVNASHAMLDTVVHNLPRHTVLKLKGDIYNFNGSYTDAHAEYTKILLIMPLGVEREDMIAKMLNTSVFHQTYQTNSGQNIRIKDIVESLKKLNCIEGYRVLAKIYERYYIDKEHEIKSLYSLAVEGVDAESMYDLGMLILKDSDAEEGSIVVGKELIERASSLGCKNAKIYLSIKQ